MKVNKEYIERLFSDIIDENIFIKGGYFKSCEQRVSIFKNKYKAIKNKR